MKNDLMSKTVVIGICILILGVSVVSATGYIMEDVPSYYNHLEPVDVSEALLLLGETAYAYCTYDPSGQLDEGFVYFDLDDPGTIENINNISNPGLVSGGTWSCNEKFLVCDPIIGYLWTIDPINGDVVFIGGGGVGLNGLTIDPYCIGLYGCSSSELYKIDQYSGEQTYIGSFSSGSVNMIGIACNMEGVLYGWDTGTDNLWIIDKETADCELVGSLGIDLSYITDGHFLFESGELFLAAYTTKGQLYYCDHETGECDLIGDFQGGAQLTAFVIPFICFNIPPSAPIIIGYENGTLFFYSNDPNDDDVKYFIDWNDGTETETGWYPSGQVVEISHEFPDGVYYIRVKAIDTAGFESPWSVYIIVIGNQRPEAPTITGETNGKAGVEYTYCIINATDPDGDDIWANFSWGDGSYSGWIGPNTSGEDICASHAWERGNYAIKAKLKDEWGLESHWSDPLPITMPKNKSFIFNFPLLNWLFERFPNAFPMLRYLLGL
jgi:hypothetical protein